MTPTPGGTAGTGTAGTGTAGTGTAGTGTAGTGTAGTGTAGTGTAGTGTAGTGTGGASGGSAGNASGGKAGAGGASGSGGSGGGSSGAGGGGGSGGGGGGMCGTASITHTSANPHDHIPDDATMLKADLKTHINGATSTMAFTLTGDGHMHTITLTAAQVMMLKAGNMVTGVVSTNDSGHTHTYTIGCTA